MRRYAPLALLLLLGGCSGFGTFLADTTPFAGPANPPIGDSENLRRVRAQAATLEPLKPEAGNVWPGPPPPEPTLGDIQRQTNPLPPPILPPFEPQGSSSPPPPPPVVPGAVPNAQRGSAPAAALPATAAPPPRGRVVQTPGGPASVTGGTARSQTVGPAPGANAGSIMIPNGNGTSTVIAPDGTVTTVPTPK